MPRRSDHAPRGGSDRTRQRCQRYDSHFNPRSPWGERPAPVASWGMPAAISIHAPRGGSDSAFRLRPIEQLISIHAPRGGSDELKAPGTFSQTAFQSTLPVGGATAPLPPRKHGPVFQSTLPVGGATFGGRGPLAARPPFQSTLPVGGATVAPAAGGRANGISIHAPRGGSD